MMKSVIIVFAILTIVAARRNNQNAQDGEYEETGQTYGQNGQNGQRGGQNGQRGGQNRERNGQNNRNNNKGTSRWENEQTVTAVCDKVIGLTLPVNCQSQQVVSQAFYDTQNICTQYQRDNNWQGAISSFKTRVLEPLKPQMRQLMQNQAVQTCLRDLGAQLKG